MSKRKYDDKYYFWLDELLEMGVLWGCKNLELLQREFGVEEERAAKIFDDWLVARKESIDSDNREKEVKNEEQEGKAQVSNN